MALVVIELETLVSEPDALTTRPPPCALCVCIPTKTLKPDHQSQKSCFKKITQVCFRFTKQKKKLLEDKVIFLFCKI